MIRRSDIGEAILKGGFTYSDGSLRETRNINDLVLTIEKMLVGCSVTVLTPADEARFQELLTAAQVNAPGRTWPA